MSPKRKQPGRPAKAPEDRQSERVVLLFTPHQLRVLDALMGDDALTRQELIRRLLRDEYRRRVNDKRNPMAPVERED